MRLTSTMIKILPLLVITSMTFSEKHPPRQFVSIGTGGVTGVFYLAGNTLCRIINQNKKIHGTRCTAESTAGTTYNLNMLRSGDIDFAIVQSDGLYHAWQGNNQFRPLGPNKNLRVLLNLHQEALTIVARSHSKIHTLEQLKGHRINIGNPGSGQRGTILEIMNTMGLSQGDFTLVAELKSSEQSDALCDNKIDAFVFTTGHPSASIREASTVCNTTVVPVKGEKIYNLVRQAPYYQRQQIPGDMYPGTQQDIETIGPRAILVASSKLSTETAYQVTRAIVENLKILKKAHPIFASLEKQDMSHTGLGIPLHPGAKLYFQEAGLH